MALIKCYECNQKVSSDAQACPKCGAPIGKSIQKAKAEQSCLGWGCLIIVGGFFAIVIFGAIIGSDPNSFQSNNHTEVSIPATRTSSISASDFIQKLESFGMKQDIPWRKSNVDDGWIAQIRCYVDPNGNKTTTSGDNDNLFNELNCQLTGPSELSVELITIEAEIFDTKTETQTLTHAIELIKLCFPDCPDKIVDSFQSGDFVRIDGWLVKKNQNDAGYEIRLEHRPPASKIELIAEKNSQNEKKQKKSGGDEDEAWVMAQAFVKKTLKSPSSASFGSVFGDWQNPNDVTKHLGNNKYRINAWVESQNSFGAMLRKQFTCVVQKDSDGRWSCLSIDVDE